MLTFKEYLEEGKRGLWDNIHAKQERIKNGSGERMRKPGSKGAPTAAAFKASQTSEERKTEDREDRSDYSLSASGRKTHKQVVFNNESVNEAATADAKGYKSKTGGLTQKGRDAYNREHGSHLQAPVTKKPSTLKKGSKAYNRRKSFCARMSGVEGPMTKPNGEPTRKALALRKWNC